MTSVFGDLFVSSRGAIDPLIFWDLTLREITDLMEHDQAKLKERLMLDEQLADQIIHGVAYVLGSTKQSPKPLSERYPKLFNETAVVNPEQELELNKAKFIDFAMNYNKARKEA